MIRLVKRQLIIPRGDTGSFAIPKLVQNVNGVAIFSILDPLTHTLVFQKEITSNNENLIIEFSHEETVNLPIGDFLWDIKYYVNPVYADGKIIDGEEIDSYYAGFSLPVCEIRQTGDSLLMADNAPGATLSINQLNLISHALAELTTAVQQTQTNVTHYPIIVDRHWYLWDATQEDYVDTGVAAEPDLELYVRVEDLTAITTEELDDIINGN